MFDIIGDKITKKQRGLLRVDPWSDIDRDGVVNGLDCQPKNKKRHSTNKEDYKQQRRRVKDAYKFFPKNATQEYINLKAKEIYDEDYKE